MGDTKIISSTPSIFNIDESFDDARFMKVRIAVMHSGKNRNKSYFSTDVIKDAQDSFKNVAILANVVYRYDEDGNKVLDYSGHDFHIQDDKINDNNSRIVYDEKVVGVVPESNNFEIIHDDQHDWDVPYVDALLYRDYGNYVCDILKSRGGKTDVSAEIYCPDIYYDVESNIIVVKKMIMSGITLLGQDKTPAMTGANASVFSIESDSKNNQMIKIMKELKESFDHYIDIHVANSKEGGKDKVKFNELLTKYNVTAEDVTFETDGLSDEELEAKFVEAFATSDGNNDNAEHENVIKCSVNKKEFDVSMDDIQFTISNLVNDTYAEADGVDYYLYDIYPEEKYVVMYTWNSTGSAYKQSYSIDNDVISLVGDRVEVHRMWVTLDEEKALNDMRANYPIIADKVAKYEEEPKKVEILNSEVYSSIAENEDFKNLCNNHFDMSVEDVTKKADEILLNSVKQHKFSFSDNRDKKVKPLPHNTMRDFGKMFKDLV